MSTSSSTSTPSRDSRKRKPPSQPRKLVRNSSLFGSIKNFVAAPFSRFFTGSSEEFDDEKDFSGKRRRYQSGSQNINEAYEDGPTPAKRLRVSSPSLSPPLGNRSGYLDPPSSTFKQNNSNSIYNPPSRSSSITIPSTTISDSNIRSTISPLRRQLSSGMTIDSNPTPTTYPRSISRDASMAAIPNINTAQQDVFQRTERLPSRDHSMPPLSGRPSFIMRNSMTPQPQRDVSEPPPMTSLSSYPVFVRGPSQARETQQKPTTTTTLGSLVDSQRNTAPLSRQRHSTLFGRLGQSDPQSTMAEKVLHELDFYKTPLVPTRLRKASGNVNVLSDITDMFSRKHSLVLMGDDNRDGRLGKRVSRKEKKEKTREDNESKPYAGTTGLKKRLAKHKQEAASESRGVERENEEVPSAKSQESSTTEVVSQVVPTPPPPPPGTDWFSLASSSAVSSSSPQASSLRVGRASRSHLSRPARPNKSTTKFSAAFDDDEEISEDSKKELAELEEAAKKVPAFSIPAGFTFAKDDKPVEPDSTIGKEPPISSLPFSLFQSPTSAPQTKPKDPEITSQSSVTTPSSSNATAMVSEDRTEARPISELPLHSKPEDTPTTSVTATSHTEGKVPNFFASSKLLSAQNPPAPVFGTAPDNKQSSAEPATSSSNTLSSPFLFHTSPSSGLVTASIPVKESDGPVWQGGKGIDDQTKSSSGAPSLFSLPSQPESSLMPSVDVPKKGQSVAVSGGTPAEFVPFSFAKSNDTAKPSITLPFSFGASDASTSSEHSTGSSAFGSGTKLSLFETNSETGSGNTGFSSPTLLSSTLEPANKADKLTSLFGEQKPFGSAELSKPFSFGQPQKSDVPSNSTLFGSNVGDKPASGFSFGQPSSTAMANAGTAAFTFGNGGSAPSPITTAKPFAFGSSSSSNDVDKPSSFGSTSSSEGVAVQPKPFSFGTNASTNSHNPFGDSKPTVFGFGSRPVTPPNQDHEVKMDESPTRDLQLSVKPAEPRPTLGGFSFNSAPSFGQQNGSQMSVGSTSSPFSFGSTSNGSNPFGGMKNDESKGFSFGRTQGTSSGSSTNSPFTFGNKQAENDPLRPSTAGSFSFGAPATTASTASFSFGTSNASVSNSNLFSQSSGSAPSSPSTFGQPTSTFGGGSSMNPFMFGSQPGSPATPSSSLPPSGFGSTGGFGSTQPQSSGSSGTLFTIGSAPAAMGANTQGRQIKRLPKRGGKR
ncbi:hypothetical protein Moror_9475 [Moniliophthora roreri MCA 2997]|uniref:Uncharacterized protein n=2 Tax=Moniliophthora roreri TaxID=221103 RepID=V2Y2W1_MONRO|nr:hypothetical protein Moror_9475 [Moniliophthora roreri MCA 2997]